MKKRIKSLVAIFALLSITVLVAAGCEEDDNNDDQTLLLLGAAYLLTGNCATVVKSSSTLYSATITGVPNGGCNAATLIGETRAAGVTALRSTFSRLISAIRAGGADCTSTADTFQTSVNSLTETTFCTSLGLSNACDTEARWAEEVGKRRYISVGNGRDEALTAILNTASLSLTAAQVASLRLLGPDESAQSSAIQSTTGACKTALQALYPSVNASAITGLTASTSIGGTAIASVASPLIASVSCTYGSSATTTNRCATLNNQF